MASDFSTIETAAAAEPMMPNMGQLSFTAPLAGGGVDLWSPAEVVGGWDVQCRAGRKLAEEAVHHLTAAENVPLLPGIVRRIVERGTFGGVEVWFFSVIAEELLG